MIDSDGNIYLTVDSLIEINNITSGSNNIILRKIIERHIDLINIYDDKDLIKDNLYQIIYQFSKNKITFTKFCLILLNGIHPFYDKNGGTCKILLANDDKINLLTRQKPKILIII